MSSGSTLRVLPEGAKTYRSDDAPDYEYVDVPPADRDRGRSRVTAPSAANQGRAALRGRLHSF